MVDSVRMARLVDFWRRIDFAGLRRNSEGEMAPSGSSEHVGKGEVLLLPIPGGRIGNEVLCRRELLHEPKDHEGVGPVGKHRGANDRSFLATLRVSRTKELLGLPVGDLDAPAGSIPLNDVLGRGRLVRIEEYGISVLSVRISTEDHGKCLSSRTMIPESRELMDQQPDLFSITVDLDIRPPQVGVPKHGCWRRQPITPVPRSASLPNSRGFEKTKQGRVWLHPSRDVGTIGASFQHRLAAVGKITDDSEAFSLFEPRMGQIDKIQTELGLGLVEQLLGFNLGFLRPPKPRSIRQTKHSVADSRKANRQADDDEADTMTRLLGLLAPLRSRTVILPTGPADLLAAVFVQGIIKHGDDLDTLSYEYFHHDSEETMGDPVHAPLALSQEPVDRGKVPGLMEPHGKNNLADGVVPHGEHPADHKCHEDPITRSTEAVFETNLVNSERFWCMFLHVGVPPSRFVRIRKTGYARNAFFFQGLSQRFTAGQYKKGETIVRIDAKKFLTDIRSGMDDEALMIRYGLMPRQLQNAFRQIINAGLATPLELSKKLSITKSQVREAFVEVGKAIAELD